MSCTSSQMNILTGQGLGPRSTNRVAQGSMDRVRPARARKIRFGRLSEVFF